MKVTVCELVATPGRLEEGWARLVEHARAERSDLVLLPEMPFHPWFATGPRFDGETWRRVMAAHDRWEARLGELSPAVVAGTRPVEASGKRLNQGFIRDAGGALRPGHQKYLLPEEPGFHEASWYSRGDGDFSLVDAGPARLGFAICTELWFLERARRYGRDGAHLVATPRATGNTTVERWLLAGRVAAIVSGAFSISSNHAGGEAPTLGGHGWVIDPEGTVLATTSADRPCATVEIDLAEATRARTTYPRYVAE